MFLGFAQQSKNAGWFWKGHSLLSCTARLVAFQPPPPHAIIAREKNGTRFHFPSSLGTCVIMRTYFVVRFFCFSHHMDSRMGGYEYDRTVLEDIQATSDLLRQVPSMSFDRLRPVLAKHGLSEVGTLAELSARASKALEGRVRAVAAGGGLSGFGERAVRMLFRMVDKVWKK